MHQVAVALAKEIELPGRQEPGAAAEAMAARLMDAWGVGEAGCNDGTVLLLSQRPRQVRNTPAWSIQALTGPANYVIHALPAAANLCQPLQVLGDAR